MRIRHLNIASNQNDRIEGLKASWKEKHAEASRIANSEGALSPEDIQRGERLMDECDEISREIKSYEADLAARGKFKGRLSDQVDWANQTKTPPPGVWGGAGGREQQNPGFGLKGMESAGESIFNFEDGTVTETGSGVIDKKTWELLNTFEYKRDFTQYMKQGSKFLDLRTKTLQVALDDQGGVFAPAELINRIIGRQPAPTKLRGVVTTITTGRDNVVMPKKQYSADDKYSTAFRVTWTGEVPSSSTAADVNDANLTADFSIPVYTAMLSASATNNMIEDTGFPFMAWLETELATTVDLAYEDMILNGSATGQPSGIFLGAASGNNGTTTNPQYPEVILSGSAGAISYDGLVDVQTALAPQYENEFTRWAMNKKSTYRALRKLKDSNNRPLFSEGASDYGMVPKPYRVLMGDEIILSQFMQDIGASNFPLVYGDFRGYYLAQRIGLSLKVLDQTRAKLNQIEIVGRVRFGGRVAEPWRLKILKSNNS